MPDTVSTSGTTIDDLLAKFLSCTPLTHHAVLVSPDGLTIAYANAKPGTSHSGDTDGGAARLSAAISGLYSLAHGVLPDGVRQLVIEGETATLFVMSAGSGGSPSAVGTRLGVLAGHEADPGNVGWGMTSLIKSLDEHLSTRARTGTRPGQEQ
jgi:predicted regulator of Ras-like GTPase activity (Roadblock/LC7/MglB family)